MRAQTNVKRLYSAVCCAHKPKVSAICGQKFKHILCWHAMLQNLHVLGLKFLCDCSVSLQQAKCHHCDCIHRQYTAGDAVALLRHPCHLERERRSCTRRPPASPHNRVPQGTVTYLRYSCHVLPCAAMLCHDMPCKPELLSNCKCMHVDAPTHADRTARTLMLVQIPISHVSTRLHAQ